MKKNITLLLFFVSFFLTGAAQEKETLKHHPLTHNKTLAGCPPPTAYADLDIANVRARMLTGGDMWNDPSLIGAQYEVPKSSGKHSMYKGALWIGGFDSGGQIRTACQTYRQTGYDFWAGFGDSATCITYDYIWKLNKSDVINFINTGTTTVQDIINYPGNDPTNSNAPLAPYFDNNGDGIYNYLDGDFPDFNIGNGASDCCNQLNGDQCLWWVINDVGNIHTVTQSTPMGLEIQCQAYGFNQNISQTANSTFYQYKMINKSTNTYNQSYFGLWADSDIGYYLDDYVGSDVIKGVGYCYNGDLVDDPPDGYGQTPPAIGVDFLRGPLADPGDGTDNNRNGIIDEPNEDIAMSKFLTYQNNNNPVSGNPVIAQHYYNYLRGFWKNGVQMTYGGNGYNPGSTDTCDFMYPHLTDPAHASISGDWTEEITGNPPGDRISIASTGPFTMLPGEVNCITVAAVWARAASGDNHASVTEMLAADSIIQILFDACFASLNVGINEIAEGAITGITPNPFSKSTTIYFNNRQRDHYSFMLYDVKGALLRKIMNIKKNWIAVERENLKSGMYIFRLADETGKSTSGKLIVE